MLDAGVERLTPDDQSGAIWPVGQRHQLGELDHRGTFAVLAVLGDGLVPELFEAQSVEDCAVYLSIGAAHDGEPDVPGPTNRRELLRAAGRVGPDDDGALHEGGVVTRAMTEGDLGRQLGDGLVEHHDVIGDRVGAGIAGTKHSRERITGAVGEAQ